MTIKSFAALAVTATLAATIALPAFAEESHSSAGAAMSAGAMHDKKGVKKTIDNVCVQKAVATREASLGSAWGAFGTAVGAAYTKRAASLNTAWGMTDAKARNAAIKAAWSVFATDRKTARTTFSTAQKNAWTTFRTAVKSCSGGETSISADAGVGVEAGGVNVDAQ